MAAKSTKSTNRPPAQLPTKSTKSTTIRISEQTKHELSTLDFVRKDTYDEIIVKLMTTYKEKKEGGLKKE